MKKRNGGNGDSHNKQKIVDDWNKRYPPGVNVIVTLDNGSTFSTVTKSRAELLSGHTPVIWVVGMAACYSLSRVTPI